MLKCNFTDRDGSGLHRARDKSTIRRLQMYIKGGKAIRFAIAITKYSSSIDLCNPL